MQSLLYAYESAFGEECWLEAEGKAGTPEHAATVLWARWLLENVMQYAVCAKSHTAETCDCKKEES